MNIELLTKKDLDDLKKELLGAINNNQVNQAHKWLRGKDAMELLGISSSKLQKLRIYGEITFTSLGGIYYYDREGIYQLLEKNKVPCRVCKS